MGIFILKGMKVGVLPGDFKIAVSEDGVIESKLTVSTAYNVLPIWIRSAHDSLLRARAASEDIAQNWSNSEDDRIELLIRELEPSMQVFVACGIALDALYEMLKPYANLSPVLIKSWRKNKTSRAAQIAETIRSVYKLDNEMFATFRLHISEIIDGRDKAVHPSLALERTCVRSDIPDGVDWKFSLYRYSNCEKCFVATMHMLIYLYEHKCQNDKVVVQMNNMFDALLQLGVVHMKTKQGK